MSRPRAAAAELEQVGRLKLERLGVIAPPRDMLPPADFTIVDPTPERVDQGAIAGVAGAERDDKSLKDAKGGIGRPYRAIDILAALERRGAITPEMRKAGEDFRIRFRRAQLDPLHAGNLSHVSGAGAEPALPARAEFARRWVWERLQLVGGLTSPAGSCLWHVVGWEESLKAWSAEHGRDVESARGILIATLCVLAAAGGAPHHTAKRTIGA